MRSFNFTFIIFLITASISATMAQNPWILQRAVGLIGEEDPELALSVVDQNTCWGCNIHSQFIRTTDGGLTWRVGIVKTGSKCASISAIDSSIAWVVATNPSGIFKTTDGGLSWAKDTTIFKEADSYPFNVHFFDPANGVCAGFPVGNNWEIYTTSNGGTNWTRVPSGNIPQPLGGETPLYNGTVSLPTVSADNCIWFTTRQGSLYRTTDRGMTWTVTRHVMDGNSTSPFVAALKDSLNGLAAAFVNGSAIKRTTDGGVTWTPVPLPSPLFSLWNIAYEKGTNGTYFITGIENHRENIATIPGTALTTDNGTTWLNINSLPVWAMDFASDGTGWGGSANDSIYKWTGFTDKMIVVAQPSIDRTFARKNEDSVLFRTTILNFSNHQFTANLIYTNLENTQTDSLTLYDDGLHEDSQPNDGIYGVYIPQIKVEDYFMLNVSSTEDSTNKYVNTPTNLRFTTAGPLKLDSLSVSKLSSTVYSVKPFFRNEGSSFTVKDLNIKISTLDHLIKIETDTINISSIAPGTTAEPTNDINITVSSHFSGVLRLNFEIMSNGRTYWTESTSQTVTGAAENIPLPLSYTLSQNYPNPFNPTTTIKYSLPQTSIATMKIYDILGKEVLTLINEEKSAGIYKVEFNESNLPSGIYFYKLQAGSFIESKKMILLK